jgi:hypothetical protein
MGAAKGQQPALFPSRRPASLSPGEAGQAGRCEDKSKRHKMNDSHAPVLIALVAWSELMWVLLLRV